MYGSNQLRRDFACSQARLHRPPRRTYYCTFLLSKYPYTLLPAHVITRKVFAQLSARLVAVLGGREGHFVIVEIRFKESLLCLLTTNWSPGCHHGMGSSFQELDH